jgi:hypothetical protein
MAKTRAAQSIRIRDGFHGHRHGVHQLRRIAGAPRIVANHSLVARDVRVGSTASRRVWRRNHTGCRAACPLSASGLQLHAPVAQRCLRRTPSPPRGHTSPAVRVSHHHYPSGRPSRRRSSGAVVFAQKPGRPPGNSSQRPDFPPPPAHSRCRVPAARPPAPPPHLLRRGTPSFSLTSFERLPGPPRWQ